MSNLIIAEKPSVARAIAEAVGASSRKDGYIEGQGWIVSWCRGHLVDYDNPDSYPEWAGPWELSKLPMIPVEWKRSVSYGCAEQYGVLETLLHRSDVERVYNACDADREGEGIFRRVAELANVDKPIYRLWSTSLVADQILHDIADAAPSGRYDGLAASAEGRAKADWLVGMNASRAYSVLYGHVNAGRVQTPTLALVVNRTRSIKSFVSKPFFQAFADLGGWRVYSDRFESKDAASSISDDCSQAPLTITRVERKSENNRAPRLYDLTGLQRDASTRKGLTADETLAALQSLYEKKLATYPRTESKFIGETDKAVASRVLDLVRNEGVCGPDAAAAFDASRADIERIVDDSKVHGHSAILPTELCTMEAVANLSGNEVIIMRLVCCRLLAAVMDPATRIRTKIEALSASGHALRAAGSIIVDPSWIAVDEAAFAGSPEKGDSGDDEQIPEDVTEGSSIEAIEAGVKDGKTTPPKHYTDATLLSAMEHVGRSIEDAALKAAIEDDSSHSSGLGTPATRAATIEKLIAQKYISRKGRSLIATDRGVALIDAVSDSLKTPELTAEWERRLSLVESGEADLSSFIHGIEDYTRTVVAEAVDAFDPGKKAALSNEKTVGKCPKCGSPVVKRRGSYECVTNCYSGAAEGYKLTEGCGFKLISKQCGKELTEREAMKIIAGETVHVSGLKRKDGSVFDADLTLGGEPWDGWAKFAPKKNRPGKRGKGTRR